MAKRSRTTNAPKPKHSKPVDTFAAKFLADPPAEAASGHFAATVRDRWHGVTHTIADGTYHALGWAFTFAGGRFLHADRLDGTNG